jgi:hypothetical protein
VVFGADFTGGWWGQDIEIRGVYNKGWDVNNEEMNITTFRRILHSQRGDTGLAQSQYQIDTSKSVEYGDPSSTRAEEPNPCMPHAGAASCWYAFLAKTVCYLAERPAACIEATESSHEQGDAIKTLESRVVSFPVAASRLWCMSCFPSMLLGVYLVLCSYPCPCIP